VADPVIAALIAERKRRGWSKRKLARHAGISASEVSTVERGVRSPALYVLLLWADALDMEIACRRKGSS
jgi:transcriptional regulator with XRE-family HTH domain